jgi:ligand-binding sensor domain-containing protein
MKFPFRALILCCFLVFFFQTPAVEASPFKRPLSFQHFRPQEGLSSEMVYAIAVQGDEVWFGTYGGGATLLNQAKKTTAAFTTKGEPQERDDGVSIKWKNHPAYNHVWVILPERDRIWFGTYFYGFGGGGISYYKAKRKNPWRVFNTNQGRAKKIVSMAVNSDWLWVGSEKGLSVLDKKTERWKAFFSTEDGLAGNFVNALLLDQEVLWIGTNAGISRMNLKDQSLKTYGAKEGMGELEIKSLIKVKEQIWAGTAQGALWSYNPIGDAWKTMEVLGPLKDGGLHSISVIKDSVFICRDKGVSVYHLPTRKWDTLTTADGLLSNTVFCATEDKDGIWFGTDLGASRLILTP